MLLATVTQCLTHGGPNYGRAGGDGDEVSRGWIGGRLARLPQRPAPGKEAHPARRTARERTRGQQGCGRQGGEQAGTAGACVRVTARAVPGLAGCPVGPGGR